MLLLTHACESDRSSGRALWVPALWHRSAALLKERAQDITGGDGGSGMLPRTPLAWHANLESLVYQRPKGIATLNQSAPFKKFPPRFTMPQGTNADPVSGCPVRLVGAHPERCSRVRATTAPRLAIGAVRGYRSSAMNAFRRGNNSTAGASFLSGARSPSGGTQARTSG
jgi:hypothetical protein